MIIRTPEQLTSALDELHDRWFDIDAMSFKATDHQLVMPYWSTSARQRPRAKGAQEAQPFDRQLIINDVLDHAVKDSERIGIYSFNKITFGDNVLRIEANERLVLTITVTNLNASIAAVS